MDSWHARYWDGRDNLEPRTEVPSHYEGIIYTYNSSEGLKSVWLNPYIRPCVDYLVLCNRSRENSALNNDKHSSQFL